MPEPFDSLPKKKKASPLKLVVSNPSPLQIKKKNPSQAINSGTGFTAEVQKIGYFHYALIAQDSFHHLGYRIVLELHNNQDDGESSSVTCHFPDMVAEELNEFVGGDETLYAMILIQFQMKILTHILLFCQEHGALNLIIYANDTPEGHALGIYENLVAYEDTIPTIRGTKTQMVIPITQGTLQKWRDLSNQANQDFRQALWEDQSCNPSIRAYLKLNPSLKFFG
ncbi:MAG: hypothetical protein K0R76_1110 [Alphaproteobacteria bacterium]|jgi:hypothetical protein|nr:hypothetical protein [Alphaproteobacteria bacterium]MDF3034156.1 hypothetical protein [Alphaproteobacteria bacterium]